MRIMLATLTLPPSFLPDPVIPTSQATAVQRIPVRAARPRLERSEIVTWSGPLHRAASRLLRLHAGWDGLGSVAIPHHVVQLASKLVADALAGIDIAEAPYLVPGGDGSVQIEWHEKHGELELDIASDGSLHIVGRNHLTGADFEGEDEKALALFFRWAAWMAAIGGDEVDESIPQPAEIFQFAA